MFSLKALMVGVVAAGLGLSVQAPASAALGGCRVNLVCLYTGDETWVSQYSEYTSYYQRISRGDIVYAKNLTPSVVRFSYSSGIIGCVLSGRESRVYQPSWGTLTGLRLSSDRSCP